MNHSAHLTASFALENEQLYCQGKWTLHTIKNIAHQFFSQEFLTSIKQALTIDGGKLEVLDSSGAWQLIKLDNYLKERNIHVVFANFNEQQHALLLLLRQQTKDLKTIKHPALPTWLARLGERSVKQGLQFIEFLNFTGETATLFFNKVKIFKAWRWQSIMAIIETMGYQALPIIAILSFMIGVVLTYQMGVQLRNYGANIFIVDLLGMSVLREFAPLITAIMIAGRTGSAFTAQIGTMKINEEIDALTTMGISVYELLIIPRLLALVVVLPLLTIWADIFGILGGIVMSKIMLNISWYDFLTRFQTVVPVKSLLIGIGKAPVFGLLIASIGCFQGMQVTGSAESVGKQTTKSVVQAIFFIIVADALFSILFSKLNI